MQFELETINDITIVTPPEMDLDASNADEFKRDITPVIEGQPKVLLNIETIGFMDSAGLGAMLSAYKKVIAGKGAFKIFGVREEVKSLFDLVRIQRLFEVYDDRESAIRSFK
jgi:anti-sigma B factor antagonist